VVSASKLAILLSLTGFLQILNMIVKDTGHGAMPDPNNKNKGAYAAAGVAAEELHQPTRVWRAVFYWVLVAADTDISQRTE
jgi:hypothetical protein